MVNRLAQPFGAVTQAANIARAVHSDAQLLTGATEDYDALLARIGNARIVCLGEASHGTHEFYRERVRITQRLIAERGFCGVAIEGDWPDAYRVNRYVRGEGRDRDAEEALRGFRRFPTWMWRNADVLDFVGWLRTHNDHAADASQRAGFYGLDLYSMFASMQAVVDYLERIDPPAAARARDRYACFDLHGSEGQEYGQAVLFGVSEPCRHQAISQLVELRRRAADYLRIDGFPAEDEFFFAEENARLVADAEEYYRQMFSDPAGSWNLRDRHMADTLDHLLAHLDRQMGNARIVVWAHNSHVGDARVTEMSRRGELNIGQLARERHGSDAVLVGFTTNTGTVTAATHWGGSALRRRIRPALPESWEGIFGLTGLPFFALMSTTTATTAGYLDRNALERAIGVIYRPETERASHYFGAHIGKQFDALIHIDDTRAVEPLERGMEWLNEEPPETYPSAL